MSYIKTIWEDYPSRKTPVTAARLNKIEEGIVGAEALANTKTTVSEVVNQINTILTYGSVSLGGGGARPGGLGVSIGEGSSAGDESVSVGLNTKTGTKGVAIGSGAKAEADESVALGSMAHSSVARTGVIGTSTHFGYGTSFWQLPGNLEVFGDLQSDSIRGKAEKTYVDTELAKKATKQSVTDLSVVVESKLDKTTFEQNVINTDAALDLKSDQTSLTHLSQDTQVKFSEVDKAINALETTKVNNKNYSVKFEVVDNQPRLKMEEK